MTLELNHQQDNDSILVRPPACKIDNGLKSSKAQSEIKNVPYFKMVALDIKSLLHDAARRCRRRRTQLLPE